MFFDVQELWDLCDDNDDYGDEAVILEKWMHVQGVPIKLDPP